MKAGNSIIASPQSHIQETQSGGSEKTQERKKINSTKGHESEGGAHTVNQPTETELVIMLLLKIFETMQSGEEHHPATPNTNRV